MKRPTALKTSTMLGEKMALMKKGSSPAWRDTKREASVSSDDESSGEDYPQKGGGPDEEGVIACKA